MEHCRSSRRRALILGVNGQDGSYLARLLSGMGYDVYGACRTRRSNSILAQATVTFKRFDLLEDTSIERVIEQVKPHELYNLAGPSRAAGSDGDPGYYFMCCAYAVNTILSAVLRHCPACRVFQAGSSEIFGNPVATPQTEAMLRDSDALRPRNTYGLVKLLAFRTAQFYRQQHGLFVVNGILYNHESPLRPLDFVSQKIALAGIRASRGIGRGVTLGNIHTWRDWGHAQDFVRGMQLSLSRDRPDDYIFATGELRSVDEMLQTTRTLLGLPQPLWVTTKKKFWRPAESVALCGNAYHALDTLGWMPEITFDQMLLDLLRGIDRRYTRRR